MMIYSVDFCGVFGAMTQAPGSEITYSTSTRKSPYTDQVSKRTGPYESYFLALQSLFDPRVFHANGHVVRTYNDLLELICILQDHRLARRDIGLFGRILFDQRFHRPVRTSPIIG